MDFNDTPELAAFRAECRSWLEANVPPRAERSGAISLFEEHDDEHAYLEKARRRQAALFDAGWAGLTWPAEYGGRGLTPIHQIVFAQESSRFDLPVEVFQIGIGMGGPTVMAWGTEDQKSRWLKPLLRGDEIWCQLFSEPGAGSDVAGLSTTANRDGDVWRVTGQKVWTSGAHYAKWGMLLARTDPTVPKHRGLTYFIIDMDQPGVTVRPLRQMTGGANFNEVFFDEALVTADGLLGAEGAGWGVALTTLMNERMSIGSFGPAERGAVHDAVARLLEEVERRRGGDPMQEPLVRQSIADLFVRAEVLRFLAARLISKLVRGEIPTAEGSAAKLAITDLLTRAARFGVDVQGAHGSLTGADAAGAGTWALMFLGYPGAKIAGGTDEIMRNIIGERILGLPGEPRVDKDVPFQEVPPG